MQIQKPETVTNIHGFLSYDEAEAHRNKLMHKDLYGLYCIYVDEKSSLWSVVPIKALDVITHFNESEEAKLQEQHNANPQTPR